MSIDGDAAQSAAHLRLLAEVENAVGDPRRLGGVRQWVIAADLDDEGRLDLLGRIDTYLGDAAGNADPWEAFARGVGPLPQPGAPRTPIDVDPDADAADAQLDLADGFVPATLPADGDAV